MRDGQQQMPGEVQPGAAQQQQHQNTQHFLLQQQQKQHQQQQQPCQLHLYIYEAEPEVLARHMLLLAVLFDGRLTVRQRAEMFLELHGNVMLRQTTADYLGGSCCCSACILLLSCAGCVRPPPTCDKIKKGFMFFLCLLAAGQQRIVGD